MKRLLIFILSIAMLLFCSLQVKALDTDIFDEDIRQIEDSVDDDVMEDMSSLGADSVERVITDGVDSTAVFGYLASLLSDSLAAPFAALIVLLMAMLLLSVAESYSASLRYTETREIMHAAVALFTVSAAAGSIAKLASDAVAVIQGASSVMLLYLPIMAGIMAFSGRAITSAGYYAAVVTASRLISRLSSAVLLPLLNVFLCVSIGAGISSRLRLGSVTELIAKGFKWLLTFSMTVFVAVVGLNGALSSTGDNLAGKAVRFTLSSAIPLIGSSIAEAYGSIQGSVNILRSGIGVFVILGLFVSFAPILVKILLWSLTLQLVKITGEALCVSSASGILTALSSYLSMLRAAVIGVMAAFILSSSVMLRIGGAS